MPYRYWVVTLALLAVCAPASAQNTWTWNHKLEIRADYRWSEDEQHPVRFQFPPGFLPPGQTTGFLRTVDPGSHVELNTTELQLDLGYGDWFTARAKLRFPGLHRRNPTTTDRKI